MFLQCCLYIRSGLFSLYYRFVFILYSDNVVYHAPVNTNEANIIVRSNGVTCDQEILQVIHINMLINKCWFDYTPLILPVRDLNRRTKLSRMAPTFMQHCVSRLGIITILVIKTDCIRHTWRAFALGHYNTRHGH